MPHAVLSPSGASRWLSCTPSARLEQQFPDRSGQAAAEGTLAHALSELIIKEKLGNVAKVAFKRAFDVIAKNDLYDNAMLDHAEEYATFVMERLAEAQAHTRDAIIFLEQKLNLTDYVPEGFGTGDVIIIANSVLDIIDLKYGKGVPVFADNNKQMMLYALGALREYDFMYDIDTVRMTIYQPRLDTISTWEIPVIELREWAETELKPRAEMAFKGEGEFVAGKHCQFCKAKAVCKANADHQLVLAQFDFKQAVLLNDQEIADILDRAKDFTNWLTAVTDYALAEAIDNNKKWPGYKLVEGRSNRKYLDETSVANKLTSSGFDEEVIYSKKLLDITAMEKEIGKAEFNKLLADLTIKPPGKPTLVPNSDKRPEFNTEEAAQADFKDVVVTE